MIIEKPKKKKETYPSVTKWCVLSALHGRCNRKAGNVCGYAKQLLQGATTKLFISLKMKKSGNSFCNPQGQGHDY